MTVLNESCHLLSHPLTSPNPYLTFSIVCIDQVLRWAGLLFPEINMALTEEQLKEIALNDSIADDDDANEGRSEYIMGKATASSRVAKAIRALAEKKTRVVDFLK